MHYLYQHRRWKGAGKVMLTDGRISQAHEELIVDKVWEGLYQLTINYESEFEKGVDYAVVARSIDGRYYGTVATPAQSTILITEIPSRKGQPKTLEIIISEIETPTPPPAAIRMILHPC